MYKVKRFSQVTEQKEFGAVKSKNKVLKKLYESTDKFGISHDLNKVHKRGENFYGGYQPTWTLIRNKQKDNLLGLGNLGFYPNRNAIGIDGTGLNASINAKHAADKLRKLNKSGFYPNKLKDIPSNKEIMKMSKSDRIILGKF